MFASSHELFLQQRPLFFKGAHTPLIGGDDGLTVSFDNAVEQLVDAAFDFR
ncbi:hypothetical protein [Caulobacter ginsengisoli]|uniref:hypothetical protein n=1 Tax=Caulobacter ginsengisoli TaxID=400775 RepID=UPI0027D8F38F|nr:hypothetical protein [Caulobacter ginsengisoli]